MQKEVDALAAQVKRYGGNSRKDKEYMYFDEMLTRELIKLDDIETEGRENVRQARKNTITSIQETIGLLESKAPIVSSQPTSPEATEGLEDRAPFDPQSQPEAMDVDRKQVERVNEPIPLPPVPSAASNESKGGCDRKKPVGDRASTPRRNDAEPIGEPMDTGAADKSAEPPVASMQVQQSSGQTKPSDDDGNAVDAASKKNVVSDLPGGNEQRENDVSKEIAPENDSRPNASNVPLEGQPVTEEGLPPSNTDTIATDQKPLEEEVSTEKLEDGNAKQSLKATKRGKKSKKQAASDVAATATTNSLSDKPILLPPPENTEADAK